MPYTKNRDLRMRIPYTYQQGGPTELTGTSADFILNRTKTGDYLPNWKTIIRNGGDATTNFDGVKQELKPIIGKYELLLYEPVGNPRHLQTIKRYAFEGAYYSSPLVPTQSTGADVQAADNLALKMLYRRIRKANSHFSGGVFLGEIREVISMIRRPAMTLRNGLGDYFSTLRKRKGRAPKHRLREILSSTWLEYSFGWQPLVNDVIAAAETLARFENDERRTSVSGWGVHETLLDSGAVQYNGLFGRLHAIQHYRRWASAKVSYRVGLDFRAKAPFGSAKRLAELSGFKLQDFVPTVWELIPWSFIVDYFTNVGDILEAMTTDTSSVTRKTRTSILQQHVTSMYTANYGYYNVDPGLKDVYSIQGDGLGGHQASRSVVSRRKDAILTIPTLEFSYPPFDSAKEKWINLAALTASSRRLTPYR